MSFTTATNVLSFREDNIIIFKLSSPFILLFLRYLFHDLWTVFWEKGYVYSISGVVWSDEMFDSNSNVSKVPISLYLASNWE